MAGSDWLEPAKELYRAAQQELIDRLQGSQTALIEIFKEDLREALLDLKQAVIAGRHADVQACVNEVTMLLMELHRQLPGEE